MLADIIIVGLVALVFGLCLKKVISDMKKGGGCSGCNGCGGSCGTQGSCPAAQKTVDSWKKQK